MSILNDDNSKNDFYFSRCKILNNYDFNSKKI